MELHLAPRSERMNVVNSGKSEILKFVMAVLGKKEGNVLFNDKLNTFYLRLYCVGHMVKDHSDSKRENPLLPPGLLFQISSKASFYIHHPTDRRAHTTAFATPVVE